MSGLLTYMYTCTCSKFSRYWRQFQFLQCWHTCIHVHVQSLTDIEDSFSSYSDEKDKKGYQIVAYSTKWYHFVAAKNGPAQSASVLMFVSTNLSFKNIYIYKYNDENNNDNNNRIQRHNLRFFNDLLVAQWTVSNTYIQVAQAQSCANHVEYIEHLSLAAYRVMC